MFLFLLFCFVCFVCFLRKEGKKGTGLDRWGGGQDLGGVGERKPRTEYVA